MISAYADLAQTVDRLGRSAANRPIFADGGAKRKGVADPPRRSRRHDSPAAQFLGAGAFDPFVGDCSQKRPIDRTYDAFEKGCSLNFMESDILTRANAGASGPMLDFGSDEEPYFLADWKAEYGVGN